MFGKAKSKTKGKVSRKQTDAITHDFLVFGNDMAEYLNKMNDKYQSLDGRFVASYGRELLPDGNVKWTPADESFTIYFFPYSVPDEVVNNHLHPDFLNKSCVILDVNNYYYNYGQYKTDDNIHRLYMKAIEEAYFGFLYEAKRDEQPFAVKDAMYPVRRRQVIRPEMADLLSEYGSGEVEAEV